MLVVAVWLLCKSSCLIFTKSFGAVIPEEEKLVHLINRHITDSGRVGILSFTNHGIFFCYVWHSVSYYMHFFEGVFLILKSILYEQMFSCYLTAHLHPGGYLNFFYQPENLFALKKTGQMHRLRLKRTANFVQYPASPKYIFL